MLRAVDHATRPVWDRLVQSYECEFSALTGKEPDPDGIFPPDTPLGEGISGWIWWKGDRPAGLAAVIDHGDHREVAEFYVVPRWRRLGQGREQAAALFDTAPGTWVVKQLANARDAQAFWRRCLGSLPCRELSEGSFEDPFWGPVVRQEFRWGSVEDASPPHGDHPREPGRRVS